MTESNNQGQRHAAAYSDLIVCQKARVLSREIFMLTAQFPREETFSLTDQVRRSSRSIGAQIAEAWAKRSYPRHFASKLSDADGERLETDHWIRTAGDCRYMNAEEASSLIAQIEEIGKMLRSMIAKADRFCQPSTPACHEVHEGPLAKEYLEF